MLDLLVDSLKVKFLFPCSIFETRGFVKLGVFSGEKLALTSCWSILAAKPAVFGRMDLVVYMDTDAKSTMRPNTLGMQSTLLSLS